MNYTVKDHVISAIQTFIATFVVTIGTEITAIPLATISDYHTWSTAFIAGLIVSAVRVAVKETAAKFFPSIQA